MHRSLVLLVFAMFCLLGPESVLAQAFGEYGRITGNVPRGPKSAPGSPGRVQPGGGGNGTGRVGDLGGASIPSRLVVSTSGAGLYPRQDEESEMITQLAQGEALVPMVQSIGGNDWFMVKTQKGVVGWIKSADVRGEKLKK